MIRHITSLILAPRKDNLLILFLVLGFMIMVTGSWLSNRHSDMAQDSQPEQWESPTPSGQDSDVDHSVRVYAANP